MNPTLLDRDTQVLECAELYGVNARFFRRLPQSALDHAWLIAREHWD